MNPMVDGWMGDDWFHNGAFRQQNMSLHLRAGGHARATTRKWWTRLTTTTTTSSCRPARPASSASTHGLEQVGFWHKILEHPAYDAFWQRPGDGQDARAQPLKVPVMLVAQPLGPGGHLRRHRRLQGDQAEGHGQRQGLPRHRPVAPRPGDRRRQHARRASSSTATRRCTFRQEVLAAVPRPVSEGRRAEGRRRAGHRLRDRERTRGAA